MNISESEQKKTVILHLFEQKKHKELRNLFQTSEAADLGEILGGVETELAFSLFRTLPRSRRTTVFTYLPFERQELLLATLPPEAVALLLTEMQSADRTQFLEDLPPTIQQALLSCLEPHEREIAQRLLSYPDDLVGRFMNTEFISVLESMSVSQALDHLRWGREVSPDHLNRLFVTDLNSTLVGEIDLATLVLYDPPSTRLGGIMMGATVFLNAEDAATDAVDTFRKYDRQQIPVVDNQQKIIGFLTSDDVFDIAEEEATEDIQQFGGQGALEDSYFQTPFLLMVRKRGGWLAILFLGMMFTGTALRYYEETLNSMGFLVFFLPLIVSSGGNSGTQAASLILRGIAIKEMTPKHWFKILRRELVVGLSLGSILGTMGYIRSYTWGYDYKVGMTVALTLVFVVVFGVVAGSMLPLMFRLTKLDPAVISSPFISTVVDITGIIIFINIALAVF